MTHNINFQSLVGGKRTTNIRNSSEGGTGDGWGINEQLNELISKF